MAAALGVLVSCGSVKSGEEVVAASRDSKVVVAYVTSWSEVMPDPQYMTHINYAFGHVNESFNGVKIDNEERLRQIVDLRKQKPELKVLLSIGGWGSGRFSEMAANDEYRRAFAADCDRVVKEFALDGIDIDWEYPTSSMANISSSPDDTENFTLLMQDIRAAIGNEKELTLATVASARYIDFKAILPSVDFVNIMAYDMASAPKHHSALYPSGHSGDITSDGAVTAHLKAGVPPSKLVMGMPFYGRGGDGYPSFQDYNKVGNTDTQYTEKWDEVAQVPYLADKNDTLVFGFENPRSLAIKCQYILDKDLLGGMYWDYSGDNEQGDLRRTVAENLLGQAAQGEGTGVDGTWRTARRIYGCRFEVVGGRRCKGEFQYYRDKQCQEHNGGLLVAVQPGYSIGFPALYLAEGSGRCVRQVYRRRPWRLDRFPSCYFAGRV